MRVEAMAEAEAQAARQREMVEARAMEAAMAEAEAAAEREEEEEVSAAKVQSLVRAKHARSEVSLLRQQSAEDTKLEAHGLKDHAAARPGAGARERAMGHGPSAMADYELTMQVCRALHCMRSSTRQRHDNDTARQCMARGWPSLAA